MVPSSTLVTKSCINLLLHMSFCSRITCTLHFSQLMLYIFSQLPPFSERCYSFADAFAAPPPPYQLNRIKTVSGQGKGEPLSNLDLVQFDVDTSNLPNHWILLCVLIYICAEWQFTLSITISLVLQNIFSESQPNRIGRHN